MQEYTFISVDNTSLEQESDVLVDIPSNFQQNLSHVIPVPVFNEDVTFNHSLSCRMSVEDYKTNLRKLTKSQKQALHTVHCHNQKSEKEPLHLFITGVAGVGKSFITNIIIAYLEMYTSKLPGSNPVVVCAPTGTAARSIQGLIFYTHCEELSSFMLSKLQREFLNIHTIVIDEISMVSDMILTYISRRLSQIKRNNAVFDGLNVIVVGDFFQLKPIKGKYVFHNKLIWHLFSPVFLTENVRQIEDPSYAQLLNRARVGLLTSQDIKLLLIRVNVRDTDCLHIFPLRRDVAEYNN